MQTGFLISGESRVTLENRRLRMKSTETGRLRTEKEMGDVLRTGYTHNRRDRTEAQLLRLLVARRRTAQVMFRHLQKSTSTSERP